MVQEGRGCKFVARLTGMPKNAQKTGANPKESEEASGLGVLCGVSSNLKSCVPFWKACEYADVVLNTRGI